jgi:hypothetical protein
MMYRIEQYLILSVFSVKLLNILLAKGEVKWKEKIQIVVFKTLGKMLIRGGFQKLRVMGRRK